MVAAWAASNMLTPGICASMGAEMEAAERGSGSVAVGGGGDTVSALNHAGVSDDMTYVELSQLKLTSKATKTRPALRLSVDGARLRGIWPLARPALWPPHGLTCQ